MATATLPTKPQCPENTAALGEVIAQLGRVRETGFLAAHGCLVTSITPRGRLSTHDIPSCFPHHVPIRSMMGGKSRPHEFQPTVIGENKCSHTPFLRDSLSKGVVMPRYLSEVKGKEFPAITEWCLEWLMREWVASEEFQDARTQAYTYFQATVKDPRFREVFHLMFGPALYRFVMRVWREGDRDIRDFMERRRGRRTQ